VSCTYPLRPEIIEAGVGAVDNIRALEEFLL